MNDLTWVKKYIGIPFEYQGSSFEGADCYGLVHLVYKEEFGIKLPSFVYSNKPTEMELWTLFMEEITGSRWTPSYEAKLGSIIILKLKGLPIHCGLVLDHTRMLHTMDFTHSCIEDFHRPQWKNRVETFLVYKKFQKHVDDFRQD